MTPTLCEECQHVEPVSKKGHPANWLCTQAPRCEGHGFVSKTYWAEKEPYMKCYGINGGACKMFSELRKSC